MHELDDQESSGNSREVVPGPERFRRNGDRDGDGDRDALPGLLGIGRSFRPGIAVPSTLLVSDMGDGALYLAGWRKGPSAYLTAEDAVPLRRELARAFGSPDGAPRD